MLLQASRVASSRPALTSRPHATSSLLCTRPLSSARNVRANNKFGDELLDFVTAGPKMRKWYGQGERLPSDGGDEEDQPEEVEEPGQQFTLVTNAESEIGEQVLLQLILARAEVKALVSDTVKASQSYGSYVTPLSLDINNPNAAMAALKRVSTVICLGSEGKLLQVAQQAGVQHVVLLSQTGNAGASFLSFLDKESAALKDTSRERAAEGSGVPYTIVRVNGLDDNRRKGVVLNQGAKSSSGDSVSREQLAVVLSKLLDAPESGTRELQVCGSATGLQTPADVQAAVQQL